VNGPADCSRKCCPASVRTLVFSNVHNAIPSREETDCLTRAAQAKCAHRELRDGALTGEPCRLAACMPQSLSSAKGINMSAPRQKAAVHGMRNRSVARMESQLRMISHGNQTNRPWGLPTASGCRTIRRRIVWQPHHGRGPARNRAVNCRRH
jgi:hypothetical protein